MNTTEAKTPPLWLGLIWLGLIALLALSGLGTIFVAVITAAQAWEEHAQEQWPQTTARVEECRLQQTSTGRRERYYIRCVLRFEVSDEQNSAKIYSISAPSRNVWQYPTNQIAPFEDWVNEHPPGTPIPIRYDPDDHTKIVLTGSYLPGGGPHTAKNLKLLAVTAVSFLVLLGIVSVMRPRTLCMQSSAPSY